VFATKETFSLMPVATTAGYRTASTLLAHSTKCAFTCSVCWLMHCARCLSTALVWNKMIEGTQVVGDDVEIILHVETDKGVRTLFSAASNGKKW
jgi:hypothetical protein